MATMSAKLHTCRCANARVVSVFVLAGGGNTSGVGAAASLGMPILFISGILVPIAGRPRSADPPAWLPSFDVGLCFFLCFSRGVVSALFFSFLFFVWGGG